MKEGTILKGLVDKETQKKLRMEEIERRIHSHRCKGRKKEYMREYQRDYYRGIRRRKGGMRTRD